MHCKQCLALQWRRNGCDGSNRQPRDCLLSRLFWHRTKKTSKLRATGRCAGNSPVTGEFPAQRASNAEIFPFDDAIMVGTKHTTLRNSASVSWLDSCTVLLVGAHIRPKAHINIGDVVKFVSNSSKTHISRKSCSPITSLSCVKLFLKCAQIQVLYKISKWCHDWVIIQMGFHIIWVLKTLNVGGPSYLN